MLVLALSVLLVASLLVLYALRQNINLFYTPERIVKAKLSPKATVRLGGMVKKGSVTHHKGTLDVSFVLTDFKKTITVHYHGVLPTLFREGQGIVAKGHMNQKGGFMATEVLAKHDEKYMPPQLKEAMSNGG